MGQQPLLEVDDLTVEFRLRRGTFRAVESVSYKVAPGEILGIVGESGSGKTITALSLLGLIPSPGKVVSGTAIFKGQDLFRLNERRLNRIRGTDISMVFQDPMTSLNPVLTIGYQLLECLRAHTKERRGGALRERAIELLSMVGIPHAESRYKQYPHEFSGGMRQRVMIAMAVANDPKLIIADEPTTALDVTIQAQVLELVKRLRDETGAATLLITHDLGVVAETCDRVVVMYGGHIVEVGSAKEIFRSPAHPYTLGLLESVPKLDEELEWLHQIPGSPPAAGLKPTGCPFHPRCSLSAGRARCREEIPFLRTLRRENHTVACHFADEMGAPRSGDAPENPR